MNGTTCPFPVGFTVCYRTKSTSIADADGSAGNNGGNEWNGDVGNDKGGNGGNDGGGDGVNDGGSCGDRERDKDKGCDWGNDAGCHIDIPVPSWGKATRETESISKRKQAWPFAKPNIIVLTSCSKCRTEKVGLGDMTLEKGGGKFS
jgi:hypothetical protein